MAVLVTYALTTLSDVKETLGIASSDHSKDNLIIRKINQATDLIENYCQRRFKATDYTNEVYEGSGIDQLVLRQHPVISFTSLGARNTSLNDNDFTTIPADQYFIDNNAGVVNAISYFWGGFSRWQATYRAGYETIPNDLAEACATLAAQLTVSSVGGGGTSNMAALAATQMKEGQRQVNYANVAGASSAGAAGGEALYNSLGILGTLQSYADTVISGNR